MGKKTAREGNICAHNCSPASKKLNFSELLLGKQEKFSQWQSIRNGTVRGFAIPKIGVPVVLPPDPMVKSSMVYRRKELILLVLYQQRIRFNGYSFQNRVALLDV